MRVIAFWQGHPKLTVWIGTVSGWASFDFLRGAQIAAALLAAMVSLCALILTGPAAWAKVAGWVKGWFAKP